MFFLRKTGTRQKELLCSTFVPEKNLAPTTGFNNIFKISIFMTLTKSYQKIKILLAAPFYTLFDHRKITKIYIIQNYIIFDTSVFAREVSQKSILALPCCMGDIIFFWSAPSVEVRKTTFATPPQRECDFFHFFNTSPAGSSKIMRMLFWNHLVGVTSPKTRSANRYPNHLYGLGRCICWFSRFIKIS